MIAFNSKFFHGNATVMKAMVINAAAQTAVVVVAKERQGEWIGQWMERTGDRRAYP